MKTVSVLIITNKSDIGNRISEKIKLLRECDTIKILSYIESISVLNTTQPSLILLYCSDTDSVGIIKEIRSITALDKVPILFITDKLNEEKLFYAFDNGIDDFFFLSDPDSIILMRIFLTLQKSVLYKQIDINKEILISANIIDKQSGIYLKEYTPIVLRNFFSKSIEENLENTIFMYVKPISKNKKRLNMYKIANTIKSIPRGNDIVAYGKAAGFYLILYNAGKSGAKTVTSRIKAALNEECKIYACAAEITTSFEEMESVLYKSIKEQIENGEEFNYLYDTNLTEAVNIMDIKDENGKRFKVFKKEFIKNFEKIVAPVFYQIQTKTSDKFKDIEIKYYINEDESKFSIKKEDLYSELLITYPTYIKVIIDIKHFEKDKEKEVKRLTYDFEDFSDEKISLLLEEMINDFENKISLNILYNTDKRNEK